MIFRSVFFYWPSQLKWCFKQNLSWNPDLLGQRSLLAIKTNNYWWQLLRNLILNRAGTCLRSRSYWYPKLWKYAISLKLEHPVRVKLMEWDWTIFRVFEEAKDKTLVQDISPAIKTNLISDTQRIILKPIHFISYELIRTWILTDGLDPASERGLIKVQAQDSGKDCSASWKCIEAGCLNNSEILLLVITLNFRDLYTPRSVHFNSSK